MPYAAPYLCGCGRIVPSGQRCQCQALRRAYNDKHRPSARERGYDTRWEKARASYLLAHPRCQRIGCNALANVVDHVLPHRGDKKLFWDSRNWESLCTHCHSGWKQSLECRGAA